MSRRIGPPPVTGPGVRTTAAGVEQVVRLPGQRAVPTVAASEQLTRELGELAKARGLADEATRAASTARASAGRWPDGPGPLRHGASSAMAKRCREANGRACETCREGEATRQRAWQAARRERRAAAQVAAQVAGETE